MSKTSLYSELLHCLVMVCVAAPLYAAEPVAINVVALNAVELPRLIRLNGTVAPLRQTDLPFRVTGTVRSISCHLGQRVFAGQVLIQLDPSDFMLQIELHRAKLAVAESYLRQAEHNLERTQGLVGEAALSSEALEQATFGHEQARALERQSRVGVEQALLDQERTALLAPFAGEIANIEIELGEYVIPGQPVVRLSATDSLKITAAVDATDIAHLHPGLSIRVVPNSPYPVFTASLVHLARIATPTSHRYPIEGLATQPPLNLPLDALASLTITTASTETGVIVPDDAVRLLDGKAYAYAVVQSHDQLRVEQRRIHIGRQLSDGLFFVTENLRPGEQVATAATLLTDGTAVSIAAIRRQTTATAP